MTTLLVDQLELQEGASSGSARARVGLSTMLAGFFSALRIDFENPSMEACMTTSNQVQSALSLRQLLPEASLVAASDIIFRRCVSNAAECKSGDVFVTALDGLDVDFLAVEQAIERGAAAVVTEQLLPYSVPQVLVPDTRRAFGTMTQAIVGNPTKTMLSVAVLGTHGKTTAALHVASMLKNVFGKVAYRTSLGVSDSESSEFEMGADPSADELADWLGAAAANGALAAVTEITDDMLISNSASGLEFDVVIIPSLRKNPRNSRLRNRGVENSIPRLCKQLKQHGMVLYNADDARLGRFIEKLQLPAISYGLDAASDVQGRRLECGIGIQTVLVSAGHSITPFSTQLEGDHNVRHALAAIATGYMFGLELHEVVSGVQRLSKLPGRSEHVHCGQEYRVIIDEADQADRLAVALHALRRHHGGPITCVAEIPLATTTEERIAFGRVLERAAGRVYLTCTRHAVPDAQKWIWEVIDGCENPAAIQIVPNRATAIRAALENMQPGQQLLLAGLGKTPWHHKDWVDDLEYVQSAIRDQLERVSRNPVRVASADRPTLKIVG